MNRRTTPKVKAGKVQKKHRYDLSPSYWDKGQESLSIVKEDPEKGFKHFILKADILKFIEIIPEWKELSKGLNSILLSVNIFKHICQF
jgi:hypothetical protein